VPLDLAPKHPISPDQISRLDYLKAQVPQAGNVLKSLQHRIQPFKFGIRLSELKVQYRFIDPNDVENFFKVYLKGGTNARLNEAYLKDCMNKTVNRSNIFGSPQPDSLVQFNSVCKVLIREIEEQRAASRSLVRLIMGPTGSGKTAFSKGLITASIKQLWTARLVPARVEYSRFAEDGSTPSESEIIDFVRKCQLRDLLIWYFFSGQSSLDILSDIRGLDIPNSIREKLAELQSQAMATRFDGETRSLREISQKWSSIVGYLDSVPTVTILNRLNEKYRMGFLISFDGFDIVNVEDFVLDKVTSGPLDVVVRLIRGILGKLVRHRAFSRDFDCHFLLYLRDTTYRRVQLEIRRKVGGEHNIPILWIAPPSYASLVHKVSTLVGGDIFSEVSLPQVELMMGNIASSLRDNVLFDFRSIAPARPISVLFSWNARNMKRHFGRMMYWSLTNRIMDPSFERRLGVAGIGEKSLWVALIENPQIKRMPSYQVLEELFLDNTRQLRPQLRLSSKQVSSFLESDDLAAAIGAVYDYGETVGFFECIFNYLTKDTVVGPNKELPGLLIMIRICQYIVTNPYCRLAQVRSFLLSLGYKVNDLKLSFFLYVLLRNEIILWRGEEGFRSIFDAVFFIGLRGSVLLKKMQYCTSYFSEALCISELPMEGLAQELIARDFSSNVQWIVNCVFNAIVGFNIVKEIEEIELAMAQRAEIDFGPYRIVENMRTSFSSEGQKILQTAPRRLRSDFVQRVSDLKKRYPTLEFLTEE